MHKGSVSDSIEAKEYAITAGINGVRDFLASKTLMRRWKLQRYTLQYIESIIKLQMKSVCDNINHNHYEDLKDVWNQFIAVPIRITRL